MKELRVNDLYKGITIDSYLRKFIRNQSCVVNYSLDKQTFHCQALIPTHNN